FSSPFRRLQNKTQVFPLPGSVFVHNRLTHSLEVASVGRSLGNMLAIELIKQKKTDDHPFIHEIGSIVSAACLAHDLGNPAFGHSGENAISTYFSTGAGKDIKNKVTPAQWNDLLHFEGNANAFRLLTHQFNGRRKGGFALTYSTLAALVKYPFGSDTEHRKNKYGFFDSEREVFTQVAEKLGIKKTADNPLSYARHPLVYLVEAADDISYQVMDIEDAHKLSIVSTEKTHEMLERFFKGDPTFQSEKSKVFEEVTDTNERIAYLRARVINELVKNCINVFLNNYKSIMAGSFTGSLVDKLSGEALQAMETCKKHAVKEIYNHRSVVEVEITGYNILETLVGEFIESGFSPEKHYSKKLLSMIPEQFKYQGEDVYLTCRSVLDFVSGMTDVFALELYRNIKGISIPMTGWR
ncbi:MAG: dGTP triphosphohydrolase, partial [Bacteroidota bacterium]